MEEYAENPASFSAARHAALRAYMSELGLTDFRSRIGQEEDDEGAEFEGWWKTGKTQEKEGG